jgi:hypothetical protein
MGNAEAAPPVGNCEEASAPVSRAPFSTPWLALLLLIGVGVATHNARDSGPAGATGVFSFLFGSISAVLVTLAAWFGCALCWLVSRAAAPIPAHEAPASRAARAAENSSFSAATMAFRSATIRRDWVASCAGCVFGRDRAERRPLACAPGASGGAIGAGDDTPRTRPTGR